VDNILAPCGITNPTMAPTGDNPAVGYTFGSAEVISGAPQVDWTARGGAFGWKLSAPELAQFLYTLRHTNILLSDSARALMNNDEFLLGWQPGYKPVTDPNHLAPFENAFGDYYLHGGYASADGGGGFLTEVVMFPGDIEAALVMNSDHYAFS